MCRVLEREGREWALDSVRQLQRLEGRGYSYKGLISYLERGLKSKPPGFAKGVQAVIDDIRKLTGHVA